MSIDSKKPGKQRKFLAKMPLHRRSKIMSGHLSRPLRKELRKRSLPVRKGDTVKIMRGDNKGKEGKITKVDYKKAFVFIDKMVDKKVDGKEIPFPLQPSNLLIVELERKDEKRFGKKPKEQKTKRASDVK